MQLIRVCWDGRVANTTCRGWNGALECTSRSRFFVGANPVCSAGRLRPTKRALVWLQRGCPRRTLARQTLLAAGETAHWNALRAAPFYRG